MNSAPRLPGRPRPAAEAGLLLRQARPVPLTGRTSTAPAEPVDVRVNDGVITEVGHPGQRLVRRDETPLELAGRWLLPGLWDAHVHLGQWAMSQTRLSLGGSTGPEQVLERVRAQLNASPAPGDRPLIGQGHRSGLWSRQPTVAELDAVSGPRPVALISGDAHHGWLNSAALALLGLEHRDEPLSEDAWFAVLPRIQHLIDDPAEVRTGYRDALAGAAARGVVGLVDFEFADNVSGWRSRHHDGLDLLRVRVASYPDGLEAVIGAGLRTGDRLLPDAPLLTMGPLKIISDGSLNTRTAFCYVAYGEPAGHGVQNVSPAEQRRLLGLARDHGLECAVHAIGDHAVADALDAFGATGARGSVEHAQLVRPDDLSRMAALPVRASVQPAHLLDDRDVTRRLWPDRAERCFPLGSMLAAGVRLSFGSDAPVSPLDPWLAMAAAVHRSADTRAPWNPAEAITVPQALAASVDSRLAAGQPADLAVLDTDPLAGATDSASAAQVLTSVRVAATLVAGRVIFSRW